MVRLKMCFLTACVCFLVLSLAGALQVSIPKKVYEFARGDNITLPCRFVPDVSKVSKVSLVVITWTVDGGKPNTPEKMVLTHYSITKQTDIPPLYEKRATLDLDIGTGKADLKLSRITLEDNRVFECRIQIPMDDEGKLAATTRLVVLVAPSKPVCKIQGNAEYGQNINLTCLSEEGSPMPVYTWEQRDVRNLPRASSPRTTDKGGILSLYNVSIETSGYYTCTSKNKIRSASCNITLTVSPPSMNMGATAGFIGGGVAALLVLGIVIYCCCCRKKKETEEEYAMGTPAEGEFHEKEPMANGDRDRRDDRDRSDDRDRHDDRDHRDERPEEDRSDAGTARRSDHDGRSDYNDRRSDYDDRRDNSDRRDYDERSDYTNRRSEFDDRRSDYTDRRSDYDVRDEDGRRHDEDRYDDDRERTRPKPPSVPNNKPPRDSYDN